MKSRYLFPKWGSIAGYFLAIPGFVLGALYMFKDYSIPGFGFRLREKDNLIEKAFENFTNELAIFLVVTGLILVAFSKDNKEDELSAKLRHNALYWSVMIYSFTYVAGLLFSLFVSGIPFVDEYISELNIFTPLVIFRYTYLKHVNKESYLIGNPKFLPNKPFKKMGVYLSLIFLSLFIVIMVTDGEINWDYRISSYGYSMLVIGLLLWTFSKNKVEDEMVMQQRLESLQLAVYFNYAFLLIATAFVYSLNFLLVLILAQFSILLFFVIRMEYVNYKNNKLLQTMEGEIRS